MSKAQAAKLKKVYDLALKNGAPVVGIYDSLGGKLKEGNELLNAYGTVLHAASTLSGVVPQISVVLSDCLGTSAITASSADFVIKAKDAKISVQTSDDEGCNCSVAIIADDKEDAISKAKDLILYMPSNNLSTAPCAEEFGPDPEGKCIVCKTLDAGSDVKLYDHIGETARLVLLDYRAKLLVLYRLRVARFRSLTARRLQSLFLSVMLSQFLLSHS